MLKPQYGKTQFETIQVPQVQHVIKTIQQPIIQASPLPRSLFCLLFCVCSAVAAAAAHSVCWPLVQPVIQV